MGVRDAFWAQLLVVERFSRVNDGLDLPSVRGLCYDASMIKVLEVAIEKVRALPEDRQVRAAQVLEEIASETDGLYRLSDAERELLREGVEAADRGDFASEADVEAVLSRYRA